MNIDPTDGQIKEFAKKDSLGRNKFLQSLLTILLSVDDGTIIDLNGPWGSGKTVLAKQLKLLCLDKKFIPSGVDIDLLNNFRNEYTVFYYNAWENDQYDPAESIIFQLIAQYWNRNEELATKALAVAKSFSAKLLSMSTLGLVDVNDASENDLKNKMLEEINSLTKKKDASADIIYNALQDTGKKHVLFIVDELDRCNPSFAVRLIETIKHYFANESVKLLFVTNNSQLSSVIEKNYGNRFSGYEYLDKIFDLIIDIPPLDRRYFVDSFSNIDESHYRETISEIADYYNMSIREIERYIVLFKLSRKYIESASFRMLSEVHPLKFFTIHLLLPLILGAKIKSLADFEALTSWGKDGKDLVTKICHESRYARSIIGRCNSPTSQISAESLYTQLMMGTRERDSEDVEMIREVTREMISLIGVVADDIK